MARNSEKAQSMLYRFRASQASESGLLPTASTRRPKAPSTISTIPACEKFRGQILREVSRKLLKIQDESLSDAQVRDLNDEINKLMKEKWSWERRIKELGGPSYGRGIGAGGVMVDERGEIITGGSSSGGGGGGKGYRYYGRAKELPGVKEMLERAAKKQVRRAVSGRTTGNHKDGQGDGDEDEDEDSRRGGRGGADLQRKGLDAKYFGWGDDEADASLLRYERKREREAEKRIAGRGDGDGDGDKDKDKDQDRDDESWQPLPGDAGDGLGWRLPTVDEVQAELIERRKRSLLENLG